jgi:hypothetical protein
LVQRCALVLLLALAGVAFGAPLEQIAHWYMDRFAQHLEPTQCLHVVEVLQEYIGDLDLDVTTPSGTRYLSDGFTHAACFSTSIVNSVEFLMHIDEVSTGVFEEGLFIVEDETGWRVGETYFERHMRLSSETQSLYWVTFIVLEGLFVILFE